VLDGVAQEVVDDLPQPAVVAVHDDRLTGPQRDRMAAAHGRGGRHGFGGDAGQVDRMAVQRAVLIEVGEPQRAFYGNQFGNTFPLFEHYGVPLWVLGGRPPYGYKLIDAGPHPNPAKAADGKRLHILAIDEPAAAAVERIFSEFLAGFGIYAIAERLTADGIPCPSAHDPDRNRHRCGIAWSKYAIRAILTNPRYTGRQVWNRQRKDEVLLDVHDVALGHTTKMRWNDEDQWIFSEEIVHPPIIDDATFQRAQDLLTARRGVRGPHKPHKSRHAYVLRGLLFCAICERRMQGHWANAAPYYRCRFPNEYAVANKVQHPLNVTLRQDVLLDPLDEWLASKFELPYLPATIHELTAAASTPEQADTAEGEIKAKIDDCDRRLTQYRAALDAGADPATVAQWITQTEAERARYQATRRAAPQPQAKPMSPERSPRSCATWPTSSRSSATPTPPTRPRSTPG
jgi:hypothetical protein